MKYLGVLSLMFLLALATSSAAPTNQSLIITGKLAYDPTSAYREQNILGWRVMGTRSCSRKQIFTRRR